MSAPLESKEFATLYVGDTNDDDGPVIDSLVQEVDAPAEPLTEPIDTVPLIAPKKITRLFTGSIILSSTDTISPQQIVPEDPNRLSLTICCYSLAASAGAKDYAFISDENGKVSGAGTLALRLRHGKNVSLDDHTGPVWVFPGPIAGDNLEITWVAVTE